MGIPFKTTEEHVCYIIKKKFRCQCDNSNSYCKIVVYLANIILSKAYLNPKPEDM